MLTLRPMHFGRKALLNKEEQNVNSNNTLNTRCEIHSFHRLYKHYLTILTSTIRVHNNQLVVFFSKLTTLLVPVTTTTRKHKRLITKSQASLQSLPPKFSWFNALSLS